MKSLLATASLTALLATSASAQDELAGYDRFAVKSAHRAELIAASIWYPIGTKTYRGLIGDGPIFEPTYAYVGAAPEAGKHPLVLLSHGSGGNMDSIGWLSSELVKHGAIVVAVNHPGSTSGDSSPRRSVRLSERAADLSAALDSVLNDVTWSGLIDQDNISTLGFSLGGTTSLGLAGMRYDKQAYKDYCDGLKGKAADCIFYEKGGVDLSNLPDEWSADMRDERIDAAITVDPGFTYAITDESIKAVDIPTLTINLGTENRWDAVDVSAKGSNLTERLSNAAYEVFGPAHHFTFLANCKPGAADMLAEEGEDPICDDPKGAVRSRVHQQIIDSVAKFLKLGTS